MNNIIEINNLTLPYCFNNFSISIPKDKFVIIAGPNSSGKTTLLKTLIGEIFTEDAITIFRQEINYYRITEINMLIKSIFLDEIEFEEETVYDELFYSLDNQNIDKKIKQKKVKDTMKLFQFNTNRKEKISELKSYEKINLELAKVLMQNPKIILLDNIFIYYTKEEKNRIINLLKKYQLENDLTIVLTTIDLSDTVNSDYIFVINNSEIIIEGKPNEVLIKDGILNRIGLELPFLIDLSVKLKDYDLIDNVDKNTTLEEVINLLWK